MDCTDYQAKQVSHHGRRRQMANALAYPPLMVIVCEVESNVYRRRTLLSDSPGNELEGRLAVRDCRTTFARRLYPSFCY